MNLAQILGLFSAFLFILVLTFTDERWQLWIQLAHFCILLVSSVLAARTYGMMGFAVASLGANSLRVAAVVILGIVKAGRIKETEMQTGEVLRREVFNLLDAAKGGRLKKLKEVNKHEIVEGVTEDYMERRVQTLLSYVKQHSPYYKEHPEWTKLEDFPVMTKGDFIEHYDEVLVDCVREQGISTGYSTSGSTGTPFTVLCDGDKMSRVNMNFISCMELNGFRMGMKRGEFRAWIKGKNTISKWKSFKNNLIMVDISNMGDESLDKSAVILKRRRFRFWLRIPVH